MAKGVSSSEDILRLRVDFFFLGFRSGALVEKSLCLCWRSKNGDKKLGRSVVARGDFWY